MDGGPSEAQYAQIAAGQAHACVRMTSGKVACWGANYNSQVGDTAVIGESRVKPYVVPGVETAVHVAAGATSSCVALADGTVKCWGTFRVGFSGPTPRAVAGISTAVEVAVGDYHQCALLAAGDVKCWGSNDSGQLGDGTVASSATPVSVIRLSTAVKISAGGAQTCALLATQNVVCWGAYPDDAGAVSVRQPVERFTGARGLAVGSNHICVLRTGGAAGKCFGDRTAFGTGTGVGEYDVAGGANAAQVSASDAHACVVSDGGVVSCWGNNQRVAAGSLGGQTSDAFYGTAVRVANLSGIAQVGAGSFYTCAVSLSGDVSCWGVNNAGQLGDGGATGSAAPIVVPLPQ
jgi:alpha-tubulin suppressor-like RCC1 family protein